LRLGRRLDWRLDDPLDRTPWLWRTGSSSGSTLRGGRKPNSEPEGLTLVLMSQYPGYDAEPTVARLRQQSRADNKARLGRGPLRRRPWLRPTVDVGIR
jgi:hypothetical protein